MIFSFSVVGCAGNNAGGEGAEIRFDSLQQEALPDAELLEHQRVLKSGTRRCVVVREEPRQTVPWNVLSTTTSHCIVSACFFSIMDNLFILNTNLYLVFLSVTEVK